MPEPLTKEIRIVSSDCDRFQRLRRSALFSILQEMSIRDVELTGLTRDKTLDKGMLWVISRMKIEMDRPILYDETVTVTTSPGERTHMVFPRYYTIRDAEGNLILRGSALWLLIDSETREPIIPQEKGIEIPAVEEAGRIELPMGLRTIDSEYPAIIRKAMYSDIDLNGHVNNTRYLDWIDDLFDMHFHEVTNVTSLQINYVHEVGCGEQITMYYEYHDGKYRIDGRTKDETVFQAEVAARKL
ncbi:MAG: hypothetical protein J6S26_02730 [Solobacterium sp.]|nr:hypothetical protein [Solobacterium sp.]